MLDVPVIFDHALDLCVVENDRERKRLRVRIERFTEQPNGLVVTRGTRGQRGPALELDHLHPVTVLLFEGPGHGVQGAAPRDADQIAVGNVFLEHEGTHGTQLANQLLVGGLTGDHPRLGQSETLAQLICDRGGNLARIVNLHGDEPAILGVLDQLGNRRARDP